ncbi:unnamed protein product, partial [Sphagnum balticum]
SFVLQLHFEKHFLIFQDLITLLISEEMRVVGTSFNGGSQESAFCSNFNREADSMLAGSNLCSICKSPTSRRCSRCKAVRYCSLECQSQHWTEGHKEECKAPSTSSLEISENGNGTVHSLCLRSSQCMTNICIVKVRSICFCVQILFPYDYFVKLYNWDMLRLPCGLINCGNSCFANVVLQCLTYTRPLTAYLLEGAHAEECRRNDWCFMCELQGHVWRVRQNQTPFSPIRILSRMQNIGNHLGYGRQEDAHEFMRFAIDSMQSTCLDGFGGENVVDPASQQTTLIHHIFGGHLQSQVKCMQCQHESNRYESMMDLAVEIHGIVESLEDALAQFTAPELLDGENKYKCDRCNAYVKADKRLTLHEAPNVLTIALKRFQSGKFGKLNKRVTFPEVLYMGPYMSQKGDEPPVYKLYAVVVHVDMLNASFFGHYICYVKDSQGAWYQIDDSKVKEVEVDKVMSQRAYMLFYSRCSPCCVPEYVAEYNENQTSEESDVWKGDQEYSSVEAMCPHLEGGEMLESMGSRREEGCKCMQDDMDSLALQNCYGASPDEGLELLSAKTSHAQTNILMPNITGSSSNSELFSDSSVENTAFRVNPVDGTLDDGQEICHNSPIGRINDVKQNLKPLLAPGFLNKSHRLKIVKSVSRASTQLRSYTNHNNGSKDGKKGLMDQISVNRSQSGTSQSHAVSGAFGAEHKQGRNESCACGSQQKWKKCCGKSSVIKGALADRQLVV